MLKDIDQDKRLTSRDRVKLEYRFGPGIAAVLWGPSAWTFKHALSLQTRASSDEQKVYWDLTLENLSCSDCTASFQRFRTSHPWVSETKR